MFTGLLGGSFNPAHGGHRRITRFTIEALGLDEVWWLVSPGNPLKPKKGMAPLGAQTPWLKQVCWNRDVCRMTVWKFHLDDGTYDYLYFGFAVQAPRLEVCFARLDEDFSPASPLPFDAMDPGNCNRRCQTDRSIT